MNISNIFNKIKYTVKYPESKIASTAMVSHNVSVSNGVTIGQFAKIKNSSVGSYSKLYNGCSLDNSKIFNNVFLYENCKVHEAMVGRYTYIASNAVITKTNIGSFCSIGPSLICGYGDHPVDWISTSPVFFSTNKQCGRTFSHVDLFEERKKITIGHDVWIGARVFIRDGVRIGNGAIVAAGSVVVKDVPDYAIVGGVPAKLIRYRFSEAEISSLLSLCWWDWPEEKLSSAQPLFAQNDVRALLYFAGT